MSRIQATMNRGSGKRLIDNDAIMGYHQIHTILNGPMA